MTTLERVQTIMAMEDEVYYAILEQLEMEDEEGYPLFSCQEIAEQFDVAVEIVEHIYSSEYCD